MWGSELGLGLVWLGATLLMLADASLGLALGLLLLSIGLAAGEVVAGQMNAALVLLLSGGIAAALQLRGGNSGWGLAHAGFTPRLMLSILVLVVVLLVAAVFHLNAPLWEAAAVTILLAGTRLIETNHRAAARAAIVALALGLIELMVTQGGIKLAQPTVPVLMMLGACGIGLLLSVLGVSPQMSRRSWLTGVVIGGVGLVLLGLAHQPILLAALLLLLIGLNSLRRDESGDRWRLRYPGLGVLLLSVSGLLLTFPLPFMSRLGSLALLLGIAAAAGLLPYLHRAQAAERGSINDPLLWSTIAAPLLAVVIFTQVVPTLPAVTQGEVRLFSLLLGLGNLGWGLLMAGRPGNTTRLWQGSCIADWGLILTGWGLPPPNPAGELASLLLLFSLPLVRLPLYLGSGEITVQARRGRFRLLCTLALIGAAPFVGFVARYQLFLGAASTTPLLVIPLAMGMLLYLAHWKRLAASLTDRPRAVVGMIGALCFSLALSGLPNLGWLP